MNAVSIVDGAGVATAAIIISGLSLAPENDLVGVVMGCQRDGYEARMSDDKSRTALPSISSADLARHVAANDVFLLDLRSSTHGKQIYGAIRYDPRKLLDAPKLALPLPKTDGLIVLYDEHGTSEQLDDIGAKLRAEGFAEVRALEGGFHAYEGADGKLEDATMEQPVPLVSEHQLER